MVVLLISVFLICLVLRFPIAFSMGIACLAYLLFEGIPLIVIPAKMYSGMDVFVLLSVPGFILAGNLMNHGGLTDKIISFCNHLFGHLTGGLAMANVGSSMLFAGISGTAVADTASIGSIMIPAMKKEGYDSSFACAVTACSSTVGPIIPPSVPMIIVATLSGLSVGKLFLASASAGLLLGLGMMVVAYVISKIKGYPKQARSSFIEIIKGFFQAFWSILMVFIILFGIIGGAFTPTEASIVAVLYAVLVGIFVNNKLSLNKLIEITINSMKTSASLMLLIGFANLFGWVLLIERLPQEMAAGILDITQNKYLVLLMINLLLIFIGSFMETIAALMILFPILLKVAIAVDVDPTHFAVFAVLNLMIGLTTPPVGVCLFVASSVGKISVAEVSKSTWPFLFVSLLILTIVVLFPSISLWLPELIYD